MKKSLVLPFIFVIFICVLCSCSNDRYSKKALCENLFSCYTADCDFTISKQEKTISASAKLTKDNVINLMIYSPDEYSGITISGDAAGNADTFCLELSDIPSSIDKSIASDLSLIFTLFSDVIPSKILSLDTNCFSAQDLPDKDFTVSFEQNGMSYSVDYTLSGIPTRLKAGNDKTSVEAILKEFTQTNQQ